MDTIVKSNVKNNYKLGTIGCGKMAGAILGGIANKGYFNPENIFCYDINQDASNFLTEKYGFNCIDSIEKLCKSVDILLIATKPFAIEDVLKEIQKYFNNQLVLSILAGVKIKKYEKYLKNSKIIRIMPNTPALVNEGISAICPNLNTDANDIKIASEIMKSCGKVLITTEDKIDIITALSGSGPAYYYKIIELMAKSAQKLGLDEQEALLLSSQTALGSAKMAIENDFDINQLIKNVTTPGGCTEVGNNVLLNSNIEEIMDKLIKDTTQKAIELG